MADDTEQEHGAAPTGRVDPASMALAFGQSSSLDPRAAAYLEEQTAILRVQKSGLEEEQRLQLSHLRLRRFSDYSKVALELAIGLVLLLIVGSVIVMMWNAAHDNDLVIEAFAVPPDIAAQGLTGQVVASEVLDKLTAMQSVAPSLERAGSYRRDLGDSVRLVIPTTGISIGELDQYLRGWLGHERRVTGEVVHAGNRLSLTVRYGTESGTTSRVAESDFDKAVEKAAESVFAHAQPLRYGDYLIGKSRFADAIAMLKRLSSHGTVRDRASALVSWGDVLAQQGNIRAGLDKAHAALRLSDTYAPIFLLSSKWEAVLNHDEAFYDNLVAGLRYLKDSATVESDPQYVKTGKIFFEALRDFALGDYLGASTGLTRFIDSGGVNAVLIGDASYVRLWSLARNHDIVTARQEIADASIGDVSLNLSMAVSQQIINSEESAWQNSVVLGEKLDGALRAHRVPVQFGPSFVWSPLAYAMAELGNISGAEAVIAETPLDCDACVRTRGHIAALKHDWRAVDHWFGMVTARSPSIPFADTEWGAALRMKGDLDSAIVKFRQANTISPHFADPLEMWGEALMLKNRSDLALAKFEDANKDAPKWGRLHMKWGEALGYVGRKDEARAQYRIASSLDLSAPDKAELARYMRV